MWLKHTSSRVPVLPASGLDRVCPATWECGLSAYRIRVASDDADRTADEYPFEFGCLSA